MRGPLWLRIYLIFNTNDVKSLQSCPNFCESMDCSLPDASVHGILPARKLERVTMPFSRGSSWPRDWTHNPYVSGIPWKKNNDKPTQHIKRQRHYFASKGLSSQSYCFSSNHVWMWVLDHKEGWAPKNWCFWTVMFAMISAFSWQNSISLCPASFCTPRPNLPITLDFLLLHSSPL